MFFKKKKPESPPEIQHQAPVQQSALGGQSKFAPTLNPNTTQIDFGFGKFDQAAPPPYPEPTTTGGFDPWKASDTLASEAPWTSPEPVAPQAEEPPMPPPVNVPPLEEFTWQAGNVIPTEEPPSMGTSIPPLQEESYQPMASVPVQELTPEQAWSMLEPPPSQAPVSPVSENEWGIPAAIPGDLPQASQPAAQDEWAAAFEPEAPQVIQPIDLTAESLDSMVSQLPEPAPYTPPFANEPAWGGVVEVSPEPATPVWEAAPNGWEAELNTPAPDAVMSFGQEQPAFEAAPLPSELVPFDDITTNQWEVPLASEDFGPAALTSSVGWSDAALLPEPVLSESMLPGSAPSIEGALSWQSEPAANGQAPMEPASQASYELPPLPIPSEGFAPIEATGTPASSLDSLWASSLVVEPQADLHSHFNASAGEAVAPAWDITEPHQGLAELAPDFGILPQSTAALDEQLPAFDPLQASREFSAGWEQSGAVPQAEAATTEPTGAYEASSWSDEHIPVQDFGVQTASPQWPAAPGTSVEDSAYLYDAPASPDAEAQLWHNLSVPESAPGEQVPLASGAMMDSISQHLYPEDPFTSAPDEFSAGENAFAEAARYLFPETVSAPLEWEESDDTASGFYGDEDEHTTVMDLGPSYTSPQSGFSEFEPIQPLPAYSPANLLPVEPQPEAFSGLAYQQPASVEHLQAAPDPQFEPYSINEVQPMELPFPESVGFESERFSETESALPQTNSELWMGASASVPPTNLDEPAAWAGEPVSTWSDTNQGIDFPEALLEMPVASTMESIQPLTPIYTPEPGFQPEGMEQDWSTAPVRDAALLPEPLPIDSTTQPEMMATSELVQEQVPASSPADADFYATAFALNELGELVPVHEEDMLAALEPLGPPVTGLSPSSSAVAAIYQPELGQHASVVEPLPMVVSVEASIAPLSAVHSESLGNLDFAPAELSQASVVPAVSPSMVSSNLEPQYATPTMPPEVRSVEKPQPPYTPPAESVRPMVQPSAPPQVPTYSPEQFLASARKRYAAPQITPPSITTLEPVSQPPAPAIPQPVTPVLVFQPPIPPTPPEPNTQPQVTFQAQPEPAPMEPPAGPEAPKTIRPKPLNRKPVMLSQPDELESQWYTPQPEQAALPVPPPSQSDMEMKLTLGNLEVMGICQLSQDRRLLVVEKDGIYALMAQAGQDKPQVNVLKIFEHNPLAYQHTFTAVEEGQAAGQGMYVTQVGTWHAIISTFQDKISLHTELG